MHPRIAYMLALVLGAGLATTCQAQSAAETLEYKVKAAFICKFASYVEWPAQAFARPDSPIVVAVVAAEPIADELARTAAGLTAEGRSLVVRQVPRGESPSNAHIVYIASGEDARLADTIAALKNQPVLVVTESNRGLALGAMINFVVVDDKVRFDIAPQAAEASRLRISARLLGVARSLTGRAP